MACLWLVNQLLISTNGALTIITMKCYQACWPAVMLVFSAERSQGAPSLANCHAAVRPAALLPQPQDPWTELAHPRRKATSDLRTQSAILHLLYVQLCNQAVCVSVRTAPLATTLEAGGSRRSTRWGNLCMVTCLGPTLSTSRWVVTSRWSDGQNTHCQHCCCFALARILVKSSSSSSIAGVKSFVFFFPIDFPFSFALFWN